MEEKELRPDQRDSARLREWRLSTSLSWSGMTAVLDGRKSQIRLPAVHQEIAGSDGDPWWIGARQSSEFKYSIGSVLWIKEWFSVTRDAIVWRQDGWTQDYKITYAADKSVKMMRFVDGDAVDEDGLKESHVHFIKRVYKKVGGFLVPMAMPRWASRGRIKVRGARVERLTDITSEDIYSEGYPEDSRERPREWFFNTWDRKYARRGFTAESNPEVWVIDFDAMFEFYI